MESLNETFNKRNLRHNPQYYRSPVLQSRDRYVCTGTFDVQKSSEGSIFVYKKEEIDDSKSLVYSLVTTPYSAMKTQHLE